jgi:hypothetical protein
MMTIDEIREAAKQLKQLTTQEKLQIISDLAADLAQQQPTTTKPEPYRDFYGILANQGPSPSAEDIDEVRREMWANFAEGDDW